MVNNSPLEQYSIALQMGLHRRVDDWESFEW
jgi:hypothetical protein